MFLDALEKQNPALIDAAISLWQRGEILPDTYVIDVDQVLENARLLLCQAEKYGIRLYLMSKQFGRNPTLCKLLLECGFEGVVAVDFKEARQLIRHGIHVAHVGHLVQPPEQFIDKIVRQRPQVITLFSLEKARSISAAAVRAGVVQPVLLKVTDPGDALYSGQEGGFLPHELVAALTALRDMPGIDVAGATHFPCMQFDEEEGLTTPTHNMTTLLKACDVIKQQGFNLRQINAPSATSCETLPMLGSLRVTHAEPGHALTGTTPANQSGSRLERVAMLYLSEISHHFSDRAYCYGGGWYRRGHLDNALVIEGETRKRDQVLAPDASSIDYCLQLTGTHRIGSAVVMCFRTQIFVTRSDVALVSGISAGAPTLLGLYDSLGNSLEENGNG